MREYIFYRDKPERFQHFWSRFVNEKQCSPRYLLSFRTYLTLYSLNMLSDMSFVLLVDGRPVAICFFPIEEQDGVRAVSIAGGFVMGPLCNTGKHESLVWEKCREIIEAFRVQKVMFQREIESEESAAVNPFLKWGFINASSTNLLIQINDSEALAWSGLGTGHRRNIRKLDKIGDFNTFIVDYQCPAWEMHEFYRGLHRKCAGRETRSIETFNMQYRMLQDDAAVISGLKHKDTIIGMCYFSHHGKLALYVSGADDPEFDRLPLYHSMIWAAIQYYSSRGYRGIELSQPAGYTFLDGFLDYNDEKKLNIARFKRGFGSLAVTYHRAIKYYDKDCMLKDMEEFRNRLICNGMPDNG